MRRLIGLDLAGYAAWLPRLRGSSSGLTRFMVVLFGTEMFGANLLYRVQALLQGAGLRTLSLLLARCNRILFSVAIGPKVRIDGGLHLVHGHVVIDGTTTLGKNTSIAPFVSIGLSNGSGVAFDLRGPDIGDDVFIGTGAKLLGPIRVGHRVKIGANAVVLRDVPDDHTAIGVPARARPPAGNC